MVFHGLHRYSAGAPMPRHRHAEPYMAIVVDGGYLEAGDCGRIEARPGDVLLHGAYEAHQDAFLRAGATVLNLALDAGAQSGFGRIGNVDAIVRLAEHDPRQAVIEACAAMEAYGPTIGDWPDLLAAALRDNPGLSIGRWADEMGMALPSISRGFARAYGVSPKRFRLEARVRRATQRLPYWQGSLASFAAELGFADQAHLSREVASMTGLTPAGLRAKSVQGEAIRCR